MRPEPKGARRSKRSALDAICGRTLNIKIAKFIISYARAYRIEIIVGLAQVGCYIAAMLIGFFIEDYGMLNVFILVLNFMIGAPFYSKMIKHPDSGPIGWAKGSAYSIIFGILDMAFQLSLTLIPSVFRADSVPSPLKPAFGTNKRYDVNSSDIQN